MALLGRNNSTKRSRSRGLRSLLCLTVAVMLVAAACGDDDDTTTATTATSAAGATSTTAAATGEPIKIGVILSLSGAYSGLGKDSELAIKAFETTKPVVDGRPVQFSIENDQSEPTTGAAVARRLVDDDSIVGIIGPSVGAILVATYPIFKDAKKPVMILTPVPYPNYNKEPYLFGPNLHPIPVQAQDFIDYANALSIKKLAVLTNDDATGAALRPVYEGLGLKPEVVPLSVTDYSPILTQLRSGGFDGLLMVAGSGEAAGHMLRSKADIGWEVETFLPASLFNRTFIDLAGDAAVGVRGFLQTAAIDPSQLTDPAQKAKAQEVQKAVDTASKGEKVFLHSVLPFSWDAAESLVLAMEEAGSTDGAALQKVLENQTFVGGGGTIKRTPTDHVGWLDGSARPAIIEAGEKIVLATDVKL